MNMSAIFGGIGRALGHRVYRLYWFGNSTAMVGRWMHRMAVGWLTWELTESTSWLGIVALADTFPMVVFSVIAGAIGDRVGCLRIIRLSQFATGCIAATFATLTLGGLITIELVVGLTFLFGSMEALSVPARMSVVHSLVPRHDLSAAIALGSTTFNAARLLGPAVAGALMVWVGIGAVIALGAVTFFGFFILLFFIRVEEPGRDRKLSLDLFGDIVHGVRYAMAHRGIRFLMILLAVTGVLVRPFMDLLPGFSAQVFGRGADGLALLLSSIGFGAMCAGLWLARRGATAGLTRLVTASLLMTAISVMLFATSGTIWFAAPLLMVVGFFMLVGGIGAQTLIQNTVEPSVRTRIMSIFIVLSWGLPAIGALAMGWLASFFGLPATIAAGGLLAVVVWLWARRAGRDLAAGLETAAPGR